MGKDQELLDACRTGNLASVEKLLSAKLAAKGKNVKVSASSGGGAFSLIKSISSLKGVNVNCTDGSGDTPLHLAALHGHIEIVLLLLECDANPTLLDTQDCSPLHLAAWGGYLDICTQLLQSSSGPALLNLQTKDGNTALHFAAHHGHSKVLSLLLQKQGNPTIRNLEDKSPLDLAAQYDRLDIVGQLVTSHPELVAQRSSTNTPLHLASRLGHHAVVKYLLDAGFPIDAKTEMGTALHEAANFCKLDVIRLLLERGINISVKAKSRTAEDILKSIPSRAAEEALNILKNHIYHQRTPDSDGEKSIVGEIIPDRPTSAIIQGTPPSVTANPQSETSSSSSPLQRKANLYKSLPATSTDDQDAPPPIPPRLSCRILDRSDSPEDMGSSLPFLSVPHKSEASVLPTASPESNNEDDKSRHSSISHDISPSSKSPTELPKKPPRKKPLSFRRPDNCPVLTIPDDTSTNLVAAGGGNYVNVDPQAEKSCIDAQTHELSTTTTTTAAVEIPTGTIQSQQPEDSNYQQNTSTDSTQLLSAGIDSQIETGTTPPTSLDLAHTAPTTTTTTTPPKRDASPDINSRRRPEPPTPDFAPPSPGTALLSIQRQILPMDKRRSKDMETITDSSLTDQLHNDQPHILDTSSQQQQQQPNTDVVVTATTLPRPAIKKRPMPLPRKSSLSSETRDIQPRSSVTSTLTNAGVNLVSEDGYAGGRPLSMSSGTSLSGFRTIAENDDKSRLSSDESGKGDIGNNNNSNNSNTSATHSVVNVTPAVACSNAGVIQRTMSEASGSDVVNSGKTWKKTDTGVMMGEIKGDNYDDDLETVQMRRSASADNGSHGEWGDNHVFADLRPSLLRGSVVGTPRDVSHQFSASNVPGKVGGKKRPSTTTRKSAFAAVMEERGDLDAEKLFNDIDRINLNRPDVGAPGSQGGAVDDVFDDFSDDWDQISATFETIGVGLSRESVFVREHEDNFAKFLSQDKKGEGKIQSVGSWLTEIGLGQYENTLVANGFDDTDFLGGTILEDGDLEHIGVSSRDHRQSILEAAGRLPAVVPIDPDNLPNTVAEWLGSLRLDYYYDTFMSHKFDSMGRVIQLWELELVTVLDITSVGHRKRILASLGERRPDPNISPGGRSRNRVPSFGSPSRSPFEHVDLYRDYTGARSRVNDTESNLDPSPNALFQFDTPPSNGSHSESRGIRDEAIHLRAPNLMHDTGFVKQWRHKPEILIKGCCNYTAHYLGSTLVKELKGAMSTQEGIAKLKKSSSVISKIPTIMLSISFKGVKFIDAVSKKVVCDHEIANIFCACQDGEHMNFFAYITKDKQAGLHYCHVFSVRSRELAGEIILTLGEAFEIAYQMALKERAERDADMFDKMCSISDGDDVTSVSSKASSSNTA